MTTKEGETSSDASKKDEVEETENKEEPAPAKENPPPSKKAKIDMATLPTRQYLDQTVVPILVKGLSALSKERPADPITFLSNYLVNNRGQYDSASNGSTSTAS